MKVVFAGSGGNVTIQLYIQITYTVSTGLSRATVTQLAVKSQSKRLNRGMMRMYEKEERKRKTTVLARVSNHLTTADPSH